jgi:hypothetical protein
LLTTWPGDTEGIFLELSERGTGEILLELSERGTGEILLELLGRGTEGYFWNYRDAKHETHFWNYRDAEFLQRRWSFSLHFSLPEEAREGLSFLKVPGFPNYFRSFIMRRKFMLFIIKHDIFIRRIKFYILRIS